MKMLLILIPFLFQIQGCKDVSAISLAPAMEYEILHEFEYNEYANPTSKNAIIIRNQVDYENELITRTSEAVKAVNFEEELIVLIDMGTRNTGGYSLNVTFSESDNYVRANVVFTFPGEGCVVTNALVNPFKLIKLGTTKYVLVTEEITFTSC
ncbi:MAG: hypothetical protein ACJARP_003241 [Vicingaceae bacterium]|jgi:hypothetical protein|uniref:protease complex subunit PrcB family protein n=1 Tax=uncultured Paraglaciecola sp. TaxID=1765024 RepID=UPI0025DCCA0D|nr:protease complex subunit PrcB family protein [uncultured Paraglaciecola sp.]